MLKRSHPIHNIELLRTTPSGKENIPYKSTITEAYIKPSIKNFQKKTRISKKIRVKMSDMRTVRQAIIWGRFARPAFQKQLISKKYYAQI